MTEHTVKSWPESFEALLHGKPFDVRKDDRAYEVGDTIVLNEWNPNTAALAPGGAFTGRSLRKLVTHVQRGVGEGSGIGPVRGLSRGYAILGLADERGRRP